MGAPKTILFVDDDESFLLLARRAAENSAYGRWEALTATSASEALSVMQQHRPAVVAIDLHMPVVDGLQLLAMLRRRFPNIAKVILSGDLSENARARSFGDGAELFLLKPEGTEGWKDVFASFQELIEIEDQAGFSGVLHQVGLGDILQLTCLTRRSALLRIHARGTDGTVYIKDGEIIHAQAGEAVGEAAFNNLFGLQGGQFELETYVEPREQTISQQWEFLLMEAARKNDEGGDGTTSSGNTDLIALLAATARKAASDTEILDTGSFRRALASREPKPEQLQPYVDELLVCLPDGSNFHILHEWQSPGAEMRLGLLQFLSQRARQLAHSLPLGEFDRLEVSGPRNRAVAVIEPTRATFVRTNRVPIKK